MGLGHHPTPGGRWQSQRRHLAARAGRELDFAEPSGDACDHYHRYPEDMALLAGIGCNSYRFSVEWARIEPEPGYFSRAALEHYRRMVGACHDLGMTPVVTYNHFTTPRWFAVREVGSRRRGRPVRSLRIAGH